MTVDNDNTDMSVKHVAQIVAAYVSNSALRVTDLPKLIAAVHVAITALDQPQAISAPAELTPAVPIKKSVTPDYIICLEDGKKFKSLKRHLRTAYQMTPEQYRAKWKLPQDYPMVAPNYSASRSSLATASGLGRKPGDVSNS